MRRRRATEPPLNNHFRKRSTGPVLSLQAAQRQGRVARLAFSRLGRDGAIAFLNNTHDALSGRPIDLAVASEDGLQSVEAILNRYQS